ncbi:MAG: phenylalanine--tRNA ligase subunit beta [Balneolaceae bacterium]
MKISYNWLRQYLDFDLTPEETENKLTLLGLEVEGLETFGSDFEGFVVGEVLDVKSHPNADRLRLCKVNLGKKEVQIVCGADNVAAGQRVPVATVGSVLPVPLPDGSSLTIKKAKLRGEKSEGMICAEDELGLGDDHSGIMVLNSDLKPGTPLHEALDTEKDVVFEIGLTPNRPDAACHIGVARDLAAVLNKSVDTPYKETVANQKNSQDLISISIDESAKCHRYVGIIVDDITVRESPGWLKNRLMSIGLRPINNVVDVTNYVLHEIGQPLHAFDYSLLKGREINVKSFDKETTFTTLDSVERKVPAGSLFICDGEGPVAIAGVMGGENSEVTGSTKRILIESAYFNPSSIRKTAKSLALQTDSSYRFERGIDPTIQLKAAKRAADLIAELTGGKIIDGYVDEHPVKAEPLQVSLRPSRANHLLGTDLSEKKISSILNRLEISTTLVNGALTCDIPPFRPDITREVDLIEEVGRVFDYNNIPRPDSAPFIAPEELSESEVFHERLRNFAKSLGYKEITTNSLLSKKEAGFLADEQLHIDTLNPVSQENTTLRTHLAAGFLKAARYNLNRNEKNLRFFELGHVFKKDKNGTWIEGVEEHSCLLLGLCGNKKQENWQGEPVPYSVFDLKAGVEALFRDLDIENQLTKKVEGNHSLQYLLDEKEVAVLSRVKDETLKGFDVENEAYTAELDITLLLEAGLGRQDVTYTHVPKYPGFEFDAAFIVDHSVRAGELSEIIRKTAGKELHNISVFDVYEGKNIGENKKSIAFRLTFLHPNKTLTIKEVEPIVQKVVQALEKSTGAKLRS